MFSEEDKEIQCDELQFPHECMCGGTLDQLQETLGIHQETIEDLMTRAVREALEDSNNNLPEIKLLRKAISLIVAKRFGRVSSTIVDEIFNDPIILVLVISESRTQRIQ